jgi:hypothetical protein
MNFFSSLLDSIHEKNYTAGLFLLILSVSGNYIAETLSCRTRYILAHNMLAKQILILFMIYFTINFTSDIAIHPVTQMQNAFYVWVFFLMFTKMNIYFTIAAFLLLATLYTLKNYKTYWKQEKNDKLYHYTDEVSKIVEASMLITVILGFIIYFIKQHREHKKFDYLKFIIGKVNCDHNK